MFQKTKICKIIKILFILFVQNFNICYSLCNKKEGEVMETLIICLLVVAILFAILFVVFNGGQKSFLSLAFKCLASFAFTALAMGIVLKRGYSISAMMFLLGFVACCFGDTILALPDMKELEKQATTITLIGGLAFALAHVFYLAGMIMLFGFAWWTILIAIALGLVFFFGNKFIGKLNYGKLTYGMPVYATFVSLVVAVSIMAFVAHASTTGAVMLLVGFICFWLSDIVLMNIYFGNKPEKKNKLYYFNLALYYAAQILVAMSLCFLL